MERILLVDDDPEILKLLRRGLVLEGYSLLLAESGEEALETLSSQPVDLVILDVSLPGIDGLEVCRHLRQTSAVPVLMLTARRTISDKVAGLESGANDYIVKPFALDEILARTRTLLHPAAS